MQSCLLGSDIQVIPLLCNVVVPLGLSTPEWEPCGLCLGGSWPRLQGVFGVRALYLDTTLQLLHLLQAVIDQLNYIPGSGGANLAA